MPGDKDRPVDGTILVSCGGMQAEGTLAGLTIAQGKEIFALECAQMGVALDAVARITTMDADDEAWKEVPGEQEDTILMLPSDRGLQIFEAVAKNVPDTYLIREADIALDFRNPDTLVTENEA